MTTTTSQFARISIAIALAAAATGALTTPSSAYSCKAYPEQADAYLNHKFMARAKAKENWTHKVKNQYGLAWSVWTIADDKSIDCDYVNGKWTCEAKAKPCLYVVQ